MKATKQTDGLYTLEADNGKTLVNVINDIHCKRAFKANLAEWSEVDDETGEATVVSVEHIDTTTLEGAKKQKVKDIEAYDTSEEVNGFSINGISGWLDRDTRTSLMNTVSIEKASGMEETTLWFGTHSLTLNCDVVMGMLAQLEMYAHKCYNVTQMHKAEVAALETIDEVNAYDITEGYPEQLAF